VLSGKFASMFGPLMFGFVSEATGSQRLAVLSLLPFFLVGLALMAGVNETRAFAQAREQA
jgi:UMF1 family MFS transporter